MQEREEGKWRGVMFCKCMCALWGDRNRGQQGGWSLCEGMLTSTFARPCLSHVQLKRAGEVVLLQFNPVFDEMMS